MPIPEEQLADLHEALVVHERRLGSLRDAIAKQQAEVPVHETLLQLGRDDHLLGAVNDIYDKPEILSEVKADPAGFFRKRGVKLPPGADVQVANDDPQATVIEAHAKQGPVAYVLAWSRVAGFSVRPADSAQ